MKTAILSVGTEILFGQIVNTNAVYLSQQMNMLGFDVMYHYTVGDNPKRVEETLKHALEECDLVLTTGGLGPTQDDLTKEIVCRVMDDEPVMRDDVLKEVERYFSASGRKMTDNNRKQAVMPSRAVIFHNDAGTAPGFALENEGKHVICMPGPPREMKRMFVKSALPYLEKLTESSIYYRIIRFFGIGESDLETRLMDLIDGQTDPTLATYAKEGECSIRVASKRRDPGEAERAVNDMVEKISQRLGRYIFSCDDEDLAEVVCRKLEDKGLSMSSAESCTGGMFASSIIDIAGASACFDRALVTYSNRAKVQELGVKEETLEKYGAVSEETALEMAEGLRRVSGSDVCVSVTGIAGPDGGSDEKPVGLVYIGFVIGDKKLCRKLQMRNVNRNWNRHYAVLAMLDTVNRNI